MDESIQNIGSKIVVQEDIKPDMLELILSEVRGMKLKMDIIEGWQHTCTKVNGSSDSTSVLSKLAVEASQIWETEKRELLGNIEDLGCKIESLQKRNLTLEQEYSSLELKNVKHIEYMSGKLEELIIERNALAESNQDINLQKQGLVDELNSVKEVISQQHKKIEELEKKTEYLKEDFDNEIGFREDSIKSLRNEIRRLEEESDIEGSLLSGELQKSKERAVLLASKLLEREKLIEALTGELEVSKKKVSELEAIADIMGQEKKDFIEDHHVWGTLDLEVF